MIFNKENLVKIFNNKSALKQIMLCAFFSALALFCIAYLCYLFWQISFIFYFLSALFLAVVTIFLFLLTYLSPVSSLILCLVASFNPYYVYVTITSYWDGQYIRALAEIIFLFLFALMFI